jgi:hypothetical protein
MRRRVAFLALLLGLLGAHLLAQAKFNTSLHKTRQGKFTSYAKSSGGMELITDIPMQDLACWKCHSNTGKNAAGQDIDPATYQPGCSDCHAADFSVSEQSCLNCHSRQVYERQRYGVAETNPKADVHANAGFTCMSCHSKEELHGDDGVAYASLKEPGAVKVSCVQCHNDLAVNEAHAIHGEKVDCAACHAEGSVACASCHFETLIATGKNRAINQIWNFKMLVKKDGKVRLGSFMTHTYDGKTNVIISSFHSHTIKRNASDCKDCHANYGGNNTAIQEYNSSGSITMTRWNPDTRKIVGPSGVVPIPADWQTALKYDFAKYDGDPTNLQANSEWSYLKSTVDNQHLYYAEPLDRETMRKLGFQVSHLESEYRDIFYFPLFGDGTAAGIQFQSSLLLASVGEDREVVVEFFDRAGNPIPVTLGGQGPATSFDLTFSRGQVFAAQSPGTGEGLQVGYAVVKVKRGLTGQSSSQVVDDSPDIAGTAVFTRTDNGVTMTEAGVPATRPLQDFTLLLDSLGAKDTGLALVNPAGDDLAPGSPATLTIRVWDQAFQTQFGQVQLVLQPGQALGKFIWEIFRDAGAAAELVAQLRELEAVVTVACEVPVAALTLRQNDDGAVTYPDEVPILTAFPVIPGRADAQ